jgi:phosphate-selective porin OprO/OprP
MAKHAPSFVRWPTALIAWLVVVALMAHAVAQEQPVAGTAPRTNQSLPPPADVTGSQPISEPATSTEARLQAIESQMQRLLDADEGKVEVATPRPSFQMGGMVQSDFLFIGQNEANRDSVGEAQNVFDFRRARLTARGEAFDIVEYAIGFDFALAGRPTFLDNYVAVTELPLLGSVRAGHFFEPFSLERFTQVRYTTFMERSLADTFAPARNLGVMAHDVIGDDRRGTWAVGVFRSNSDVFGDDFSKAGGWAVTTRGTWLPTYDEADAGRSLVHVGAAYTYRSVDPRQLQFSSFPEARAGTPGPRGIPVFVDTGIMSAQSDQRLGAELAIVRGPLYLQAEYMCSTVDQIGGPPLFFQGAYAFASFFLTGENRTYNKRLGTFDRVYPFENVFRVRTDDGVQTGRGAWEVAVRWSYIDLDSRNVQGGTLNDITLALNWHLNPFTRVKWEYIYAHLDRAPIGESFAQIAGMRFDMDF